MLLLLVDDDQQSDNTREGVALKDDTKDAIFFLCRFFPQNFGFQNHIRERDPKPYKICRGVERPPSILKGERGLQKRMESSSLFFFSSPDDFWYEKSHQLFFSIDDKNDKKAKEAASTDKTGSELTTTFMPRPKARRARRARILRIRGLYSNNNYYYITIKQLDRRSSTTK